MTLPSVLFNQLCVSCRIDTWQIRVGPPLVYLSYEDPCPIMLAYNIHVSQLGETCLTFFSLVRHVSHLFQFLAQTL